MTWGGSENDDKIANLKILIEQIKGSLAIVKDTLQNRGGWQTVSVSVVSRACDTVVDPRSFPGFPLLEIEASTSGDVFLTDAGDPIPQLGEERRGVY